MDVNGTRFHLVLTRDDWASMRVDPSNGTAWDAEKSGVRLCDRLARAEPFDDREPDPPLRRGAAADRYGGFYWIGEDRGAGAIFHAERAGAKKALFWPKHARRSRAPLDFGPAGEAVDRARARLRGLAVTEDHYLVAGTVEPPGLLVFDLHAGGPPTQYLWPREVAFEPFDLSPRPGGGVFVLDRREGVEARLWALDRHLRVVPFGGDRRIRPEVEEDFRTLDGPPRVRPAVFFPRGAPVEALAAPLGPRALAIESLPDGSALVLEHEGGAARVRRFSHGLETAAADFAPENAGRFGAQDLAFVADATMRAAVSGTLYLAAADGSQAFAFGLLLDRGDRLELTLTTEYLPLRLFGKRALVSARDGVYYDRVDEVWIKVTEVPRPRFVPTGVIPGRRFDGREPGCVWHRLFVDGCIPPDTAVLVRARAADEEAELTRRPWIEQPKLHLRDTGREIPYTERKASGRREDGTWELLFQDVRGRHLELELELRGPTRASPLLRALRVHYPRFSYLERYLPAVYREDEASASFLDRFLANTEGTLTEIEGRIANVQALFDVRSVPPEWLEWLASWLGAVFEPAWDEPRRRLFLRHAPQIYRERGTVRGLEALLELAIAPSPSDRIFARDGSCSRGRGRAQIVEHFLSRSRDTVGDLWTIEDGAAALHAAYRAFVEDESAAFPPLTPEEPAAWRAFLDRKVAPVYADVGPHDTAVYRAFLARRYLHIEAYRRVYPGSTASGWEEISLPSSLPATEAQLQDWIDFVSRVLPIRNAAHRFSVLVPATPGEPDEEIEWRRSRVEGVVRREKPAHTEHDVRLFWDVFQVGRARVGVDTELGPGVRFYPMILDRHRLAEAYLDAEEPWRAREGFVLGRDPVFATGEDRHE